MGVVVVQALLHQQDLVVYVTFLVLKVDVRTLLSIKDTPDDSIDISFQEHFVSFKARHDPVALINYFLIHQSTSEDTLYVFYTGRVLKILYCTFRCPSVNALETYLRSANRSTVDADTVKSFVNIKENC